MIRLRRIVLSVRTVSCCIITVLAVSSHARADDGPAMFRSSESHSGAYASAPADQYAGLQWRFQTGGAVRSSPVVSDGAVYFGSSDGGLYALDASSGSLRWRFDAGSAVLSSPATANGRVYLQGYDGTVYALDARSGATLWQRKTGADVALAWGHESGEFYVSSPVLAGGVLYLGSGDGFLYALDPTDGHVRWRTQTGGRIRSSPAVAGGVAYVGAYDGVLYAVDVRDGRIIWRYATAGSTLRSADFGYDRRSIQSSPAVGDGAVFVGSRDGSLYAVEANSGTLRWSVSANVFWYIGSPAFHDGLVFADNSDARFVQALDARTGKEVWRFKNDTNFFSSPAVAGNAVYAGDFNGSFFALDERTGRKLWRVRTQDRILSSAAVAGRRAYVGSDDGAVYALNVAQRPLHRAVFFDPALAPRAMLQPSEPVKTWFANRDYEVLDANALAPFMKARLADGEPSVIVFAEDIMPASAAAGGSDSVLRRYLARGGKAVWLGWPPLIAPFEQKDFDLSDLDRAGPQRLLGVSFERGNFDRMTARPTAIGKRWGLSGWWLSAWAADPATVTTVLATDELGLAAAWVRSFGGPDGTGFVAVPLQTARGIPLNLDTIQAAAEYLPRTTPGA